jgi:response regulator RpfG family c-di-GMP phosphodiesterase
VNYNNAQKGDVMLQNKKIESKLHQLNTIEKHTTNIVSSISELTHATDEIKLVISTSTPSNSIQQTAIIEEKDKYHIVQAPNDPLSNLYKCRLQVTIKGKLLTFASAEHFCQY